MKRIVLLLCMSICLCPHLLWPKTCTVKGEYVYLASPSQSVDEAKRIANERARIQALANEFGTVISQSISTAVMEGGSTGSQFQATSQSDVRGEWIADTREPEFNIQFTDGVLRVEVTVEGKARDRSESNIDLNVKLLRNGTDSHCESSRFSNGDDMFLMFRSPVKGYLVVYLLDQASATCYCLLPYRNSDGRAKEVKADRDYILFSPAHADEKELPVLDEYTMTCGGDAPEINELYVVFSPVEFIKPSADTISDTLPSTLSVKEFHKWLGKLKNRDEKVKCVSLPLTVVPSES